MIPCTSGALGDLLGIVRAGMDVEVDEKEEDEEEKEEEAVEDPEDLKEDKYLAKYINKRGKVSISFKWVMSGPGEVFVDPSKSLMFLFCR